MNHDDFDFEPVPGLPAALPEGEKLLWQGSPDWKTFALRAYHVRQVAAYFAILLASSIAVGFAYSHAAADILVSCALLIGFGGIAVALLALLAYFSARSTVYSITSRRVLLRHGVAVPMTMNVPLKLIDGVSLKRFREGTGDIALRLPERERIGYLITWPHLRPGKINRPQPAFRALRDPGAAAAVLSEALAAADAAGWVGAASASGGTLAEVESSGVSGVSGVSGASGASGASAESGAASTGSALRGLRSRTGAASRTPATA